MPSISHATPLTPRPTKMNPPSQLDEPGRLREIVALCCATGVPPEKISGQFKSLLPEEEVDWYGFTRAALPEGVLPLVYHHLLELRETAVPTELLAAFEGFYNSNRQRNSALIQQLIKIMDFLKTHGIRAIPYKGPMLAAAAYGNADLRQVSDDVDILVHCRDFERAKDLLLLQGFQQWMELEYKSHLRQPVDNLEIDLHRSIIPRWYGFSLDFDEIWARRSHLVLSGTSLPCFSLEDFVIALCLDLAKDAAQRNVVRLIKLCDIAQLLKAERGMDWNRLLNRARSTGTIGPLFFGIRTLTPLFGVSLPETSLGNKEADLALAALDGKKSRNILDASLHKITDSIPAAIRHSMYEALLIASLHDRAGAKIRTVLRPCLVPTIVDLQWVSLPRYLHYIYYILRPIRLAIKYFPYYYQTLNRERG